jgi:GNAT superfamily N-acetyltransferase
MSGAITTTPITIAPLTNDYCQRIIDLILPIQQIEFNVPITLEGQRDLLDIETNYIRPGGGFWGAIHEGELIGTIALMDTGHSAGAIRKMFVKKEFRGKELAIAQQLLAILIEYCNKKGITDLYLGTVDVLKAAHRFYERNSFQRIKVEDLPSYFPRMMADNVFYHLHLD